MRRSRVSNADGLSCRKTSAKNLPEGNVLDNERLKVDFTPLYQCIHIYGALDALDEIRKSYQADRQVVFASSRYVNAYSYAVTGTIRPDHSGVPTVVFVVLCN